MENPCDKVFVPKTAESSRVTGLCDEEVLKVLEDTEKRACGVPIRLAYLTGMRAGEVCALTWDRVDFEKRTLYIEHGLTSLDKTNWRIDPFIADSAVEYGISWTTSDSNPLYADNKIDHSSQG